MYILSHLSPTGMVTSYTMIWRLWWIRHGYDDVIKWKHFPRYWPFLRGIHRSPVNSPRKGQWRGALMFSLICVWINSWINNCEAGDLRRYRAHYHVIVMGFGKCSCDDTVLSTTYCISISLSHCLWSSLSSLLISRSTHPAPGPRLNIKTVLSTYGDFHVKDKTAVRTSYL